MTEITPTIRCEIVREIRTVLVRHYLDLGRLQFSLAGRTVLLSGFLDRLPGAQGGLSPQIVEIIIRDLRSISNVSVVNAEFDNWRQNDGSGAWVETKRDIGRASASHTMW